MLPSTKRNSQAIAGYSKPDLNDVCLLHIHIYYTLDIFLTFMKVHNFFSGGSCKPTKPAVDKSGWL